MCYTHFSKLGHYHFKTTTTTTKRPDSKCFLTTGNAFTASRLLKRWFLMPSSLYILSNKRIYRRALPVTESVASCFFHSHWQTRRSRGKLPFFLSQTKIRGEKRCDRGRGGDVWLIRWHSHPSRPSWPPALAVNCSLVGSPQHETWTNHSIVLWLCCCCH